MKEDQQAQLRLVVALTECNDAKESAESRVRELEVAIQDALSVAAMEGRDFSMSPWADLKEALDQAG